MAALAALAWRGEEGRKIARGVTTSAYGVTAMAALGSDNISGGDILCGHGNIRRYGGSVCGRRDRMKSETNHRAWRTANWK
jgi:hypothetical protein